MQSIRAELDSFFKIQERSDKEVLNQIILYIYYLDSKSNNSDLFILARLLPSDLLYKLISYYDGDILKMPSKEDFKRSFIVSTCFYLKEIKNWEWPKIKEFFPSNNEYNELLSSISIGKQINKIKDKLGHELLKLIKGLNIEEIKNFHKELFEDGNR